MIRLLPLLQAALEGGDTVVTARPHQAVLIRRAWGHQQRARGLRAWPTPIVLPLGAWISRAWSQMAYAEAQAPRLLSGAQEQALWDRLVRTEAAGRILEPAGLADAAMRAWRIAQDWAIDAAAVSDADTEEACSFARWAASFIEQTAAGGWIDTSRALWRLPGAQCSGESKGAGWLGVGFDTPTTALCALLERLRTLGTDARLLHSDGEPGAALRIPAADPADELRAAANWARQHLLAEPDGRLLIVVPDLERRRDEVQRLFEEVLAPEQPLKDVEAHAVAFTLEGGVPLVAYPLIATAMTALEMLDERQPFEIVSRWLRSPFLGAGPGQTPERAKLDLWLRRRAPYELDLENLCEYLAQVPDEDAAGAFNASFRISCGRFMGALQNGAQPLTRWSSAFSEALTLLGWPGGRPLNSAEFQTLEKFHAALAELATLDAIVGPADRAAAVKRLRRVLQGTTFQPQTPECPIDITSRLADPGLQYDGVWISGLHATAWPPAPRLDPFISWQAQIAAGVPDATAAGASAAAARIGSRLFSSASEVIVSWPRRLEEEETLPSPLILGVPQVELARRLPDMLPDYRQSILASSRIEALLDAQAPPLQSSELLRDATDPSRPAALPGGATTLRLQSQCPFRAFAERRLLADEPQSPQPGIDAATRGTFVHRALKWAWDEIGSQERLQALDEAARRRLWQRAAARASAEVLGSAGRWPPPLIELERHRLVALLEKFAQLELTRPAFRVVATETPLRWQVSGLEVRLSADRIDELEDGRRVMIDYKTGVITPKVWYGERPEDPQLPLYAVSSFPSPAAVVFASLRADGCDYQGAGAEPAALSGLETTADWPAQLAQWATMVERVANEFIAGVAAVDPSSRRVCAQCRLHALCRIEEIDGVQGEEDVV